MRLSAKIAGLEIVGDEVRVALVKTGAKRPTILEAHVTRATYADPAKRFDAMVTAVKSAVDKLKTRPTCFVLCASGLNGVARILTVPFKGRKRVATAVPFELEPYLAVPIEEMAVDFSIIREVEGKTETLAIAMRMSSLEEHLAVLKGAGIDPEEINLDAAGLTALWYGRQTGKLGLTAALHVREQGAVLAVVNEKVLAYIRYLSIPAARFRDNPAAAARDVQNSLRAFLAGWQSGVAVQGICVTGIALTAEEQAEFEDILLVPVRYENLVEGLKGAELLPPPLEPAAAVSVSVPALQPDAVTSSETPLPAAQGTATLDSSAPPALVPLATPQLELPSASEPAVLDEIQGALPVVEPVPRPVPAPLPRVGLECNYWEGAIGCAVAAAGGGFEYDFRKGEISRAEALRGAVVHAVFSSSLALLAIVAYVAYCYVDYRHNVAETERLGQEAWDLFRNSFPDSPAAAKRPDKDVGGALTMELFNKEVDKMSVAPTAPLLEVFQKPTFLDVLSEIAAAMPSGGKALITEVKLTSGRSPHLEIRGEESDPASINEAHDKLAQSKVFKIDGDVIHETQKDKSTFRMTAVP